MAISAVAASEVAADQTLAYMKRRQVFGRRLGDLQYPAITVGTAHERWWTLLTSVRWAVW